MAVRYKQDRCEKIKSKIDKQINELSEIKNAMANREKTIEAVVELIKLNDIRLQEVSKYLKLPPMYIHQSTGKTWSGRGRKPEWFDSEGTSLYVNNGQVVEVVEV